MPARDPKTKNTDRNRTNSIAGCHWIPGLGRAMMLRGLLTVGMVWLAGSSEERTRLWGQVDFPKKIEQLLGDSFRLSEQERRELQKIDVPLAVEREYGEQVFAGFKQQLTGQRISLSDKNRDAKYLLELANRVKPLMTHHQRYSKLRVYVVESPDIDARSIPGGILVFYRGLLEGAESEAALIGIVGHELSHLDRKHQLKPLQQQILARQKLQQLGNPGNFDPQNFFEVGKLAFNSFHPFHPEEEAEADLDAVRWMHQLGYQPIELSRLFQRLSSGNLPGLEFLPGFLRTHPSFPERAEKARQEALRWQQIQPKTELIIGRRELQERKPAPLPADR
jgi:predicted Zn-dependent protease